MKILPACWTRWVKNPPCSTRWVQGRGDRGSGGGGDSPPGSNFSQQKYQNIPNSVVQNFYFLLIFHTIFGTLDPVGKTRFTPPPSRRSPATPLAGFKSKIERVTERGSLREVEWV